MCLPAGAAILFTFFLLVRGTGHPMNSGATIQHVPEIIAGSVQFLLKHASTVNAKFRKVTARQRLCTRRGIPM
jgi:hypothetical protein